MGIPRFFRWIGERYPCLSQVVKQYQIPDFDNLYLDVNGIIHTCSHPDDDNPHFRITEEKIFGDICRYIEFLFTMIKPQKVFFIAVDGVAPRAKMNQQRGRRFKSAKMVADQEEAAKRRGEKLPDTERFDSNGITPGTEFMARLDNVLNHFIQYKVSSDPNWQTVKVYYSSHSVPGEGEHKIMDYLRHQRAQPDYDPETRHCLYGLDTDLIMLGLVTHEPHFSLLREEILFKRTAKRPSCPEQTTFFLLHLKLFREYLEFEFRDLALSPNLNFHYDIERIIDDWVLIEFLIGNDFIPHVPDCHVASNDLPELWRIYKEMLPTLGGYINNHGRLNLQRFEKFIQSLAGFDRRKFESRFDDLKYMAGKKKQDKSTPNGLSTEADDEDSDKMAELMSNNEKKLMKQLMPFYSAVGDDNSDGEDGAHMMPDPSAAGGLFGGDEDYDDEDFDGDVDEDVEEDMAFRSYKRDYYRSKMQLAGEKPMRTADFVRLQVASYVEIVEWTLRYYYEGVPSWSYFYPFHYAPYLSDMTNIADMKVDFTLGQPFHPFEQLMSVLPSASRKLLPSSYRSLMTDQNSSIKHFYPEDFATDLNGKQLDWEAVVLIPFIEEQQLLAAIRPLERTLTPAERERNAFGTIKCFYYSGETKGTIIQSTLSFIPKYTKSAIQDCLKWNQFTLLPNQVNIEYPRKALQSLTYVPNFPTFKHLPCSSSLYAAGTSVFKMPSRNQNMIVKVSESVVPTVEAVESVAANQIGTIVLANWPFLTEARIISIYTPSKYFTIEETDYSEQNFTVVESAHTEDSHRLYEADIGYVRKHFYTTHGLDFRQSKCIVYAVLLTGIKYAEDDNNQLTAVKLWSTNLQPFPYEGIVYNVRDVAPANSLLAAPTVSLMTTKLGELYPLGESVFVVNENYFGRMGIVMDYNERRNTIKVRVRLSKQPRFDEFIFKLQNGQAGVVYSVCQQVARKAGVSSYFLSRITGCIRVVKADKGNNGEIIKVNIGLDLKHTRDNLRIPSYTLRDEKGTWLYSSKVVDVVKVYLEKFPQLMTRLQELINGNTPEPFAYADVFPEAKDDHQLDEVRAFLLSLPTAKITPVPNNSFILEEELVQEVDKYIIRKAQPQFAEVFLKPDALYRPKLSNRVNLLVDHFGNGSGQNFNLLDRVINIAGAHSVPVGLEGTVIGVLEETNTTLNAYEEKPAAGTPKKVTYEVMFDSEFQHGQAIRCPEKRGYRMFPQNLLGIRRTVSSSKQVSTETTRVKAADNAKKKEPARAYSNVVSGSDKANNKQNDPADTTTAFWKAVGGRDATKKTTADAPAGPWPLVPANLLQDQTTKQQKGNKSANDGGGKPSSNGDNSTGIPIPPRLLLKTTTTSDQQEGSLTTILKSIGVPEVATAARKDASVPQAPSVPVIGGNAPAVAVNFPLKQQKKPAQQPVLEEWEPKDLVSHDWDKIMSGAGIKVTALGAASHPNATATTKKQQESPQKTAKPNHNQRKSQTQSTAMDDSSSRGPLRERQSGSAVSGNQFVKLFNGPPAGGGSSTFHTGSTSEDDGVGSPTRRPKPKKTPLKKPSSNLAVVDEAKMKNVQNDLALLKAGIPVEFAGSSPSSPEILSPTKPAVSVGSSSSGGGGAKRIDANQLLASVASNTGSASKPKKAAPQQLVPKEAVDAIANNSTNNTKQRNASSRCSPRREVSSSPRKGGTPQNKQLIPLQQVFQGPPPGFNRVNANNNNNNNNGYASNYGAPPPTVPTLGAPAPPPSALPIPVTVAGSLMPSSLMSAVAPPSNSSNNAPASLVSIGSLLPGHVQMAPSSTSAVATTPSQAAKPLDLNLLLNKQPQQQQQQQMAIVPHGIQKDGEKNSNNNNNQQQQQQPIPLTSFFMCQPQAENNGSTTSTIKNKSPPPAAAKTTTTTSAEAAANPAEAAKPAQTKPKGPRLAACFGAPPVSSTTGQ